jgi:hypothetical protein
MDGFVVLRTEKMSDTRQNQLLGTGKAPVASERLVAGKPDASLIRA